METKEGKPVIYAETREAWRRWLKKNSRTERAVWLVLARKKSNLKSVSNDEATEEALCFGWIDSLQKKRDDESYYLTFTPRNTKSNWSAPNRERAGRMIAQGLMTEQGQTAIDVAKSNGRWMPQVEPKRTVVKKLAA
jgi:uncharacterized protein YdeI (YjbR/CyaY-like superfamily)